LEFEYGLRPLCSDIKNSLTALTETEFEVTKIRGRASERFVYLSTLAGGFGSNPKYSYYQRKRAEATLTITCRAKVRITNPNLFLASQLGLIDLALPWKLIPFSFIVDWLVNVEQVASAYTAWLGVELHDPHYTEFIRGMYHDFYWQNAVYSTGLSEGLNTVKEKEQVECNRVMGLPGPVLQVKPFRGFGIERGAQAIALVLSVFGR
jgi:hypothetical protein